MKSVVKECVCKSDYQDARYGKNMRVMNPMAKNNKGKFKCTVCERVHA